MKPLTLAIGKNVPPAEEPHPPATEPASGAAAALSSAAESHPAPSHESLAEVYEAVKRHEETLRDMIVEIRLLYHNLAEKEKQRLEMRREGITREVRDGFAHAIHALEQKIARLRGK